MGSEWWTIVVYIVTNVLWSWSCWMAKWRPICNVWIILHVGLPTCVWYSKNDVGARRTSTPSPCSTPVCVTPFFFFFCFKAPCQFTPLLNMRSLTPISWFMCVRLFFSYGNIVSDLRPLLGHKTMARCIRLRMHVTVSEYDLLAGFYDNDYEPSSFTEFRCFIARAHIGKRRSPFYFSIILL
jgi:hypothetical protein